MSSFFATLSEITPAPDHRPHAVPVPSDVSAAFVSLAEAFEVMRQQASAAATQAGDGTTGEQLLSQMIESLLSDADTPPREVEGVSEEFCDSTHAIPHSLFNFLDSCAGHRLIYSVYSARTCPQGIPQCVTNLPDLQ